MYEFLQRVVIYTGVYNGGQILVAICVYKLIYTLITMRCEEFQDGTWVHGLFPFGITYRNYVYIGCKKALFIIAVLAGFLASLWLFITPIIVWYILYTLGKYYGCRDYSEHVALDMFVPFYTLLRYGKEGIPKWLVFMRQNKATSTKKTSTKKTKI